jgi:hypothetical protein
MRRLKKVVKQLSNASRLHKRQSNIIKKHIKSMSNAKKNTKKNKKR